MEYQLYWIPLINALVSVMKLYFPKKYSPLFSLLWGFIFSFGSELSLITLSNWFSFFTRGLILGLAASGFYSIPGVKVYEEWLGIKSKNQSPP